MNALSSMLLIIRLTTLFSARSFLCAPPITYRARLTASTAVLLCLVGLGLVIGSPAHAHEIRPAYLKLTQLSVNDAASMTTTGELAISSTSVFFEASLRQPQIDGRFLGLDLATNCAAQLTSASLSGEALIEVSLLSCGDDSLQKIEILGLDRTMIDALVSITRLDGSDSNHLITAQETSLDLGSDSTVLPAYLLVGFEHLVLGYDHILFVLMLLYLVSKPRQIFWVVSSFTLAHSLSLALSALDVFIVAQRPIEAAIAASIVLLAYEILTDRRSFSHRFPSLVAFSFGLIHGLGFAGALSEIGLPEGSRFSALLLFNIGIEMGQIAIVMGVLIALRLLPLRRLSLPTQAWLRSAPAVVIGGVASYWFLERAFAIVLPLIS